MCQDCFWDAAPQSTASQCWCFQVMALTVALLDPFSNSGLHRSPISLENLTAPCVQRCEAVVGMTATHRCQWLWWTASCAAWPWRSLGWVPGVFWRFPCGVHRLRNFTNFTNSPGIPPGLIPTSPTLPKKRTRMEEAFHERLQRLRPNSHAWYE